MDSEIYGHLIRRFWRGLILIVAITTIGTLTLNAQRKSAYEGSVYLAVAQAPQSAISNQPVYQFGDYYSIQGSNYLADFVRGWLKDPATLEVILRTAGSGLPDKPLNSLTRYFSIKPSGTVGLEIFHTTANHDETNRILTATQQVVTDKLGVLQAEGLYTDFRIIPGAVLVKERKPDPVVAGLIGFGSGLLLALLVILILSVTVPKRS
ncbi:hypothetical protein HY524_01610 [Candidatus Berkelbacteria bacterium]|nr:hypothetical protein [Candidatus Berkelbacteria bacterium]